jgi:hypothetical protein
MVLFQFIFKFTCPESRLMAERSRVNSSTAAVMASGASASFAPSSPSHLPVGEGWPTGRVEGALRLLVFGVGVRGHFIKYPSNAQTTPPQANRLLMLRRIPAELNN